MSRTIKKSHVKVIAVVIAVITILGGIFVAAIYLSQQHINRDEYQVVQLSSGQTFFGKLRNTSGEYLTLEHPYTLQNLSASSANKSGTAVQTGNGQTTLLKVRDQTYGPESSMAISSKQVLFWQNLRSDSKVAAAIKAKE